MFLAKNKELLEAFKEGTKEAMEEVYLHYEPGVKRFLKSGFSFRAATGTATKGIPTEDDLNVAVQEVFRRAFEDRARNAYNGINSFSNWVLAIARNMVINQFRNREVVIGSYVLRTTRAVTLHSSMERTHASMVGYFSPSPLNINKPPLRKPSSAD